jgi:hypothetical protein
MSHGHHVVMSRLWRKRLYKLSVSNFLSLYAYKISRLCTNHITSTPTETFSGPQFCNFFVNKIWKLSLETSRTAETLHQVPCSSTQSFGMYCKERLHKHMKFLSILPISFAPRTVHTCLKPGHPVWCWGLSRAVSLVWTSRPSPRGTFSCNWCLACFDTISLIRKRVQVFFDA